MSPTLLWLVSRGPLVWAALVIACGLLGALVGPRLVASFGIFHARRMLRAIGTAREDVPAGESVPAVLSGVLGSDREDAPYAALSVALRPEVDGADPEVVSDAAPGLVLTVGRSRLRIEGRIDVTHGSRAAKAAVDLAKIAGDEAPRAVAVRALHAGDRVRVSGVVEALHEADARQGYRGAAPTWRLSPGVAGRVLMAFEGPSESTVARPKLRVLTAMVFAALWALASTGAGAWLLHAAAEARGPIEAHAMRSVCRGGGVERAAIASSVPMLRARALDAIALTLACRSDRTRATWDAVDALHRTLGTSCLVRASLFEELTDYERAAREWVRCGTPEGWSRAARLSFALGRFRDASDALSHTVINPRERGGEAAREAFHVHLLAGERGRAAAVVRGLADLAQEHESVTLRARSTGLYCLEASLQARDGDARALARLRGLVEAHPRSEACRTLRDWLSGPEARLSTARFVIAHLSRGLSFDFDASRSQGLVAMAARFELDPTLRRGAPSTEGLLHVIDQARFDAVTGALDDAQRALATARESSALAEESQDVTQENVADELREAEALLAFTRGGARACGPLLDRDAADSDDAPRGTPWEARCAGFGRLAHNRDPGDAFWSRWSIPERPPFRAAITRGDARAVLDELRAWHAEDGRLPRRAAALTAFVNRAASGPLRAWLATEDRWTHDDYESLVRVLSERLDAARALGDRALVDEVTAILARHRAALLDEDNALAMYEL